MLGQASMCSCEVSSQSFFLLLIVACLFGNLIAFSNAAAFNKTFIDSAGAAEDKRSKNLHFVPKEDVLQAPGEEEELKNDEKVVDHQNAAQPPPAEADVHLESVHKVRQTILPPNAVPLKLDEIQPPDHIDGLRVEQDGHLNADYKKEILLGNHEEFEQTGSSANRLTSRLKIVFIKADTNHDSVLVHGELKAWIMHKVQEHLDEAVAENKRIFNHLDADRNGSVSWKEFHAHFMLAKGYSQNETLQHVEDYDTLLVKPEERERIIRYKFRWAEADEEPQDNVLTIDEMMNFRHPEQSSKMIIRMAKDILENLDLNEDGIITEEEFVALPPADLDGMVHDHTADDVWQNERRKEFQTVIDINHDGNVDIDELKLYVDPHNENHASLEADNLIQLADLNGDGMLSIDEMLENAELFLGSKMVDTGRNFHDEF